MIEPTDRPPVVLQIGSQRHQGWQSVRIRLSLDQVADDFELGLTERWSEAGQVRPVTPGEACTVAVGDELVVTGYLDEVLPDYDAERHSITARGRSRAADLVDCSGIDQRFDGRTLVQIARALAEPYGIEVIDRIGASRPLRAFALEDGQPIAEALERAAQIRGARIVSDAEGRLLIVHAVQREIRTPLVLGSNIRAGRGQFSDRDRFNEYVVEGQTPGDDSWHGEAAASPRARAQDPRVRAPRRTLIVSDTPADPADCQARAELEARRRWAQGRGITYTVGTWRHEQGVWRPGDLVPVRDPYLGLDERLLVSEVQLLEDDQGRRAELRVAPPAAFEPVPVPEPKPEASSSGTTGSPAGWGW
ncbi:phage baseplate assembly protein [Halomonas sp. HG01]|uniref:phage baseplate assembly protein n=1 Tax=Halomonas sp. HG01 TaxID=1609967 RepID=UPI00156F1DB2|nr:contractile injection system protein, VgrG/Pvc8 family [Halomonas sp. HG01]